MARALRTAEGPEYCHRPIARGHRRRQKVHEGVPTNEDVQRSVYQPRSLSEEVDPLGAYRYRYEQSALTHHALFCHGRRGHARARGA